MTSRVQKGGAIFKPVAKARPRASNTPQATPSSSQARRHASAYPESVANGTSSPSLSTVNLTPRPPLSSLPDDTPLPGLAETAAQAIDLGLPSEILHDADTSTQAMEAPARAAMPPMLRAGAPTPVRARESIATPIPVIIPSTPANADIFRVPPVPITPAKPLPIVASQSARTPLVTARDASGPLPPPPLTPVSERAPAARPRPPVIVQALEGPPAVASLHQGQSTVVPSSSLPSNEPPLQYGPHAITVASQPRSVAPATESAIAVQPLAPADTLTTSEAAGPSTAKRTRSKKKASTLDPPEDGSSTAAKPKSRRGRKRKSEVAADANGEDAPRPKRKRRAKAAASGEDEGTPTARKRRKQTPAFDPDADPGEEIDPTTITMAELCEDTGQGRVSSKAIEVQDSWAAWKIRSRENRARIMARKERKKLGKPEEEDDEVPAATPAPESDSPAKGAHVDDSQETMIATARGDDSDDDFYGTLKASQYTTQIRLGAGSSLVIDEESTQVDRTADEDTSGYTHVVEHDRTKFINSNTYTKKVRGSRWSAEETDLFYDALRQYGENYELLAIMLPGRDRKSCQNKFKAEDKKNPHLINAALKNSVPIDMQTLSRITGKDFSGPTPEIRVPSPPPPPPKDDRSPRSSPEASRLKTKKRGRSKSALNDGAEVIGNIDDFQMDSD